ncbi:hypothetical protein LTR56_015017 [Elasticomyces elasticus]|nr:hypothetical protein LTR56_015017 [Elasticomyces elasticus]KAK3646981.1 hypothetical protein LTR22_014008 [Elasticomyces elasticus]KAK4916944.1 hypothetical protein LTR49_015119 [Elasticomyces elasticus]KAK5754198.1 hypothetical protein LTS12_015726 [Elasticomyces elasticus]
MVADDDFEIVPAIAEAMGFAAFGAQAAKKRKYEASVDPGTSAARTKDVVKGANSLPLGNRKKELAYTSQQICRRAGSCRVATHDLKSINRGRYGEDYD